MDQFGPTTYLSALIMALFAIWILSSLRRQGWHRNLQNAAVWVLIFLGAIAGFGLWEDIKQDVLPRQAVFSDQGRAEVEVPLRPDGHYYLTLEINGVPIEFVVDTGASQIVLTQDDAATIGIDAGDLNYLGRAFTANGEVRTAPVRLNSVSLGPVEDKNVAAYVNEGEMFQSLLGMAYLQRWDRIEISDGKLVLTR